MNESNVFSPSETFSPFKRILRLALICISLTSLIFLYCCANYNTAVNQTQSVDSFYLQKNNPVHIVLLSKTLLQNTPAAIQFAVRIVNKKFEVFNVIIFITDSLTSIPVGNFTAYPLNNGGIYDFEINDPMRKFLSARDKSHALSEKVYLQFVLSSKNNLSDEFHLEVKQFQWIQKLD